MGGAFLWHTREDTPTQPHFIHHRWEVIYSTRLQHSGGVCKASYR